MFCVIKKTFKWNMNKWKSKFNVRRNNKKYFLELTFQNYKNEKKKSGFLWELKK